MNPEPNLELNLDSETVDHAHPTDALVVAPHVSVREVFELLKAFNRGSVVVCSAEGKLVGIFTERDAVRLMVESADLDVPIEQVMVRDVVSLVPEDTVGRAISVMSEGGFRRVPILDEHGRPVGMLGVSGILHYMVEHFPRAIYTLPPRPHPTTQDREGA